MEIMAPASSSLLLPSEQGTVTHHSPSSVLKEYSMKPMDNSFARLPSFDLEVPKPNPLAQFSAASEHDEHLKFVDALEKVKSRYQSLLTYATESEKRSRSEIFQACKLSLQTRMPLILQQTEQLIESAGKESRLVVKMRSSFSLIRAMQYLDRIQEGMEPDSNDDLNTQLQTVLEGLDLSTLPEEYRENVSFRVSPWVASALCFDLTLGQSAHTSFQPRSVDQLPLDVEVEPVVEFRANNHSSVKYAKMAARPCFVKIDKVTHVARSFACGAGYAGEAMIRVHVCPFPPADGPKQMKVWGSDDEAELLRFKEARAVQINAFPPKPKSNVDMYVSYVYGDSAVTVTMVIKTFVVGESNEVPNLHIELFMAPPQADDNK